MNCKSPFEDAIPTTTSDYDALKRAVAAAGFFALPVQPHGTAHRLIMATRRRPDGAGLWGHSFWVTVRGGHWYLATWAPFYYRFPPDADVATACIDWLANPTNNSADISESFRHKHRLARLTSEDADAVFPEWSGPADDEENDNLISPA